MSGLSKILAIMGVLTPIGAGALGIGDIRLQSALNQNLQAEIPLILSGHDALGPQGIVVRVVVDIVVDVVIRVIARVVVFRIVRPIMAGIVVLPMASRIVIRVIVIGARRVVVLTAGIIVRNPDVVVGACLPVRRIAGVGIFSFAGGEGQRENHADNQ